MIDITYYADILVFDFIATVFEKIDNNDIVIFNLDSVNHEAYQLLDAFIDYLEDHLFIPARNKTSWGL